MNKLEYLDKSVKIFLDVCNNIISDQDINFIDVAGCTPLGWAVVLGNYELVKSLLNRGANSNVKLFPYLYQIVSIDWIVEPALSVITQLLSSELKLLLQKDKVMRVLKVLRDHGYITKDGILLKYIVNSLFELNNHECLTKSMLVRWRTQEEFDRKLQLSFWLYPKVVDSNNSYIQKFYKNNEVKVRFRTELINKYSINANYSFGLISEMIPLSNNGVEVFMNESWNKIIVPDMIVGMLVNVVCLDKNNS